MAGDVKMPIRGTKVLRCAPKPGMPVQVFEPETSRLLAGGVECCDRTGLQHAFTCEYGSGALLHYYFSRGGRSVIVQSGEGSGVAAHLDTHWRNGRREWTLDW